MITPRCRWCDRMVGPSHIKIQVASHPDEDLWIYYCNSGCIREQAGGKP
jgi:hypothetical protein